MSLLNLWSLFKSTLFLHLSLMDKIMVLAPPTKRKHLAPPPVCSKQAQHTSQEKSGWYYSHKVKGRHLSYNLQQISPANKRVLYYTLEQSERNFRKKPKLESQHHFYTSSSSPCSIAAKKHSTLPKKRASPTTLEQSQKKNLELLSFILVLLLYY